MSKSPLTHYIQEYEFKLAKLKAVQDAFPNAKTDFYLDFHDPSVNQNYTNYSFERSYNGLFVVPYCEVKFTYNNKEEITRVHSIPRRNKLVHLTWRRDPGSKKRIMKFARMAINMKNNKFKDDMFNACKAEIMSFIKDNPNYILDTKHLEPRLKKLLLFT